MEKDINILIVDENSVSRALNGIIINKLSDKLKVSYAASGEEAISMANKGDYNLVFMDIVMPDMNGIDALSMMLRTSKNPSLNIIGVSASVNQFCIEKFRMAGAKAYTVKDKIADFIKEATAKINSGSEFFIYN